MKKIQPPALRPYLTLTLWQEFLKRRGAALMKKNKGFSSWFLILGLLLVVPFRPVRGQFLQVPALLNFQSILTDPAGVPLPDGIVDVDFSIVDAEGTELYAETQQLESSEGVVSAMIGAQGALSPAVLDPAAPKFLRVSVPEQRTERTMEIVTVPYSMYAQQALAAAPGSIGTEAIQAGSITAEHLAEGALDGLLGDIQNNFFYSQGGGLPTVLRDLDVAVRQRQVNLDNTRETLQRALDAEEAARITADTDLQRQIGDVDVEANGNLQRQIDEEESARITADTTLQENIDVEELARITADSNLQGQIDSEQLSRQQADASLQSQIDGISASVSANQSDAPVQILDGVTQPNSTLLDQFAIPDNSISRVTWDLLSDDNASTQAGEDQRPFSCQIIAAFVRRRGTVAMQDFVCDCDCTNRFLYAGADLDGAVTLSNGDNVPGTPIRKYSVWRLVRTMGL